MEHLVKILIVEDEPKTGDYLRKGLREAGFVVELAQNGIDGLHLALEGDHDLAIFDVMLPGINGWQLLDTVRRAGKTFPVLFLTARDQVEDRIKGLGLGADDYLVKPFSLVELEVRLKALVRRAGGQGTSANVLRIGELSFNTDTWEVARAGQSVHLTKTGYTILRCLMREYPRTVTRDRLEHEVWGDQRPDSDALRTHIHAVRQALDKPFPFAMLRTIPGVGFRIASSDAPV